MKATIVFILCYFFSMTMTFAQKTRATAYFTDGIERKGFAKLVGSKQIKFRSNKKQKGRLFTFKEVEKVKIYYKHGTKTYAFVLVEGNKLPKIMEVVKTGKVNWYINARKGRSSSTVARTGFDPYGKPIFIPGNTGLGLQFEDSYLRKEGQTAAVQVTSHSLIPKNFRKTASKFFKDCPALVAKIQDNTFGKEDIKKIITFYNSSCQ